MEKMVLVGLYCDTTGLYNEDEMSKDNLCELLFPEKIVKDWYYKNVDKFSEETASELSVSLEECTFDMWFEDVYTADDMDGLYEFAMDHGFKAVRDSIR